jgi:hypothetical protein
MISSIGDDELALAASGLRIRHGARHHASAVLRLLGHVGAEFEADQPEEGPQRGRDW